MTTPWYEKKVSWYENKAEYKRLDTSFPFRAWNYEIKDCPPHWHEHLEIIYVLRGKVTAHINGQIYKAVPGDIILINTNLVHQIDAIPETEIYVFQFGLELFDQTLNDLRERVSQKLVFDRKVFFNASENADLYHRIEDLLLTIRQEYYTMQEGFRLVIKARLYDLAMILLREIPAKNPIPDETAKLKTNHQHLERIFSLCR
jgi:mannose-6-phosphate isomerase-like protein (cupin superfamily)